MKIKNVSPFGDLDLPLIGRVVKAGEVFEIAEEDGLLIIEQTRNWKHIKPVNRKPAAKPAAVKGGAK